MRCAPNTCAPVNACGFISTRERFLFKPEYYRNSFLVFNDLGVAFGKVFGILINTVVTGSDIDKSKYCFVGEIV